jgi:predicted CXXCH cytochrome family protein
MEKSSFLLVLLPITLIFGLSNQIISTEITNSDSHKESYHKLTEDTKCLDCHSDLIGKGTKHPPATESCETCHDVKIKEHTENGADGLMLVEKVPELCYACHDRLKSILDTIRNIHPAIKSNKSCNNCHSPHSSTEKKLLVSEEKTLCLSCHNKDITLDGKKTVNIAKLLANSKTIHPPLENDGCVVCHQPHGSTNNYLLIGAFPVGNYASAIRDNFAFCWECHDSDLLEVAVTASKTNFRDGAKNLHYLHRTGKNGRTCIVCHNVHASQNKHLIENKVKFGEWELPIRYKSNENGGSCFPGCHSEKTYTR